MDRLPKHVIVHVQGGPASKGIARYGIDPTSEQTGAAASCAFRIVKAYGHPQTHAV